MTARARAFLALGAYVCLAAHLSALLHVVVVRHATCPSHGEVVHGEALESEPAVTDHTVSGHPAEAEAPDEHCLFLALRRDVAALSPVAATAAAAEHPVSLAAPAPSSLAVDPAALLRLAPKTSPPPLA